MNAAQQSPLVHLVDDDAGVRDAAAFAMKSNVRASGPTLASIGTFSCTSGAMA